MCCSFDVFTIIGWLAGEVADSRYMSEEAFVKATGTADKELLAVGGQEFELVSDTHQLNALFGHLAFQVLPIVAALCVVLLIVDGTHNVSSREPPLVVLLVPHGPHFTVIEKAYGLFLYSYYPFHLFY